MKSNEFGVWEIILPDNTDGTRAIKHGSKVKIVMVTKQGTHIERIPTWINRVEQDLSRSPVYEGILRLLFYVF